MQAQCAHTALAFGRALCLHSDVLPLTSRDGSSSSPQSIYSMPKRSVTQTMLEECRPFDEDYWCVCVCVKEREKERERLCACMPNTTFLASQWRGLVVHPGNAYTRSHLAV